jgi:hypothetical protein
MNAMNLYWTLNKTYVLHFSSSLEEVPSTASLEKSLGNNYCAAMQSSSDE